ncbi:phospholipase D zeta 1-like isoform X2 [Diospyros lotus]|uniref:phospholipase D zeta 1-like isoform X2 n=1 Tax=Diospyros lotus TaxID=55363 RepID=UPI0022529CD0|nr:phospholipase D zeta 1-like isoform X2 [Diospyros lotus]
MSSEYFIAAGASKYVPVQFPPEKSSFAEPVRVFEELPEATIVSVSRPDASDFSPLQLSYTIELQYKQFKWRLVKKASQVIYLHFALKKRAIIEEFHEKQEQVKEWLHNIGIGDQTAVMHDHDEPDDGAVPINHENSAKNRYVPSRAAFPIIRPALGPQQTISGNAKLAMQGYLNHFLGDMNIVNSREVCKFLEASKLSFLAEYGPKLKEGYVMVKHLAKIPQDNECHVCRCFDCFNKSWQKVWAVLKPGFLALLDDPLVMNLLDVIIFDVLPVSNKEGKDPVRLAEEMKERNPLCYSLKVSCGNRSIKLRTSSNAKAKEWVSSINDAALKPPEGWCRPHRFNSFAPPRGLLEDGSEAQWFVDGRAAFEAIASTIETAKSEIYITGWWLCPELYLRRPFHSHSSSRLDALLETKARQGVQIYILLYKEVSLALKINSLYSKRRLLNIHENVKVLRYPDRFPTGIYLWSHHEKLVIVDYRICFIGGLDLCFGRYDTTDHKVDDYPPSLWPGKDYYNPRESEPNSWEDTLKDELDRRKFPRMPWHDVHCALWGPACRDIARHFVQRWNHAKRNKAPNEQTIPLLMPHHHMVLPHYMGRSREINIESNEEARQDISRQDSFSSGSPLIDIPLLLPPEADKLDTCNVNTNLDDLDKHQYQQNLHSLSRIGQNLRVPTQKSKVEPSTPDRQMKGFIDDVDLINFQSEMNMNELAHSEMQNLDDWWESQERIYHDVSTDQPAQVGPCTPCQCQVVRSVSQWSAGTHQSEYSIHSAYCSLIEKAEHFIYIENQFFISGLLGDEIIQNRVLEALYKRILRAHKEEKCFRVIIVLPLMPGFQGGLDDGGAATVRAIMHWQYRTICRGKNSILHNLLALLGPKANDYISFYGLRTYGTLSDGGQAVTSQVYVHSKLMIIDDRTTLLGSSNINDRSLLGSRDSEIGLVIEDKEFIESSMNGNPWMAGNFASSLRLSLWSEHLGLRAGEINQIRDPIADSTYKDLWLDTAKMQSSITLSRKQTLFSSAFELEMGLVPKGRSYYPQNLHPVEIALVKMSYNTIFPFYFHPFLFLSKRLTPLHDAFRLALF